MDTRISLFPSVYSILIYVRSGRDTEQLLSMCEMPLPVLCTLGGKYKFFVFLTRLLPTKVLTDLVGEIYAK